MKFGGSSLDSTEKIRSIAAWIKQDVEKGDRFLLVVSAMGKTTNQLLSKAKEVSQSPNQRELDMLLTAGERISMALISLALNDIGVDAISFTGSQAGILTSGEHGDADIHEVRPIRVEQELKNNKVVIIAGFQGVDPVSKEITTLGRGGTDTTAIAMAAHFQCAKCEFKKDTEGVFNKDPHQFPEAQHIPTLSWADIVSMTNEGAPFLHKKAALFAQKYRVPLEISHAHIRDGKVTRVFG